MPVRGVRGANAAESDTPQAILEATRLLLQAMLAANPGLQTGDLAAAFFTLTPDLSAAHPAAAARALGWSEVPLICAQEIPVPGSLERCIRVLLLWNTELPQSAVRHVYLGQAASLRPDLSS
ncbi:MAG: chorismate mutase [Anaerolineales bacterium]|nr:chorismate mutase [Anaerolineales bacterium]